MKDFPDDRLRYLYESVRLRTMRAASDFLGMAPSSISRQIAGLERELGFEVIEKNRHTLQLTAAGERLVDYYKDRLSQREALLSDLGDLRDQRTGTISIAIGKGLVRVVLAQSVAEFTSKYPGVKIEVRSLSSRAVLPEVRDDHAHFGIVMDVPSDPRVKSRSNFVEPYCLLVAANSELARLTEVDILDLPKCTMILPEEGFRVRDLLADYEDREHMSIDVRITASSIQFIADMVVAGSLVTILPIGCVTDYIEAGRLVAIPLRNSGLSDARLEIITRIGRKLPSAALNLIDLIERRLKAHVKARQLPRDAHVRIN